jgi:uncharacterized protein (DUF1330 family)
MKRRQIFMSLLIVPLFALVIWYQGGSEPLSVDEVESYLSIIQKQEQNPGGRHDFKQLRSFLENDDGKPFYTVNLYKYYPSPQYEHGSEYSNIYINETGRDAFDRFSKVMVKLLARNASHPIFGTDWVDEHSSDWDRLVIVRYRSRRDIAEIFASEEFADASEHKWAALADNDRLLVQGLHIPSFYLIALILTLFIYTLYSIRQLTRKTDR